MRAGGRGDGHEEAGHLAGGDGGRAGVDSDELGEDSAATSDTAPQAGRRGGAELRAAQLGAAGARDG